MEFTQGQRAIINRSKIQSKRCSDMIPDAIPTRIQKWNSEVNAYGILASSNFPNISNGKMSW